MTTPRCFHGHRSCGFCGPRLGPGSKRRCACCGRFIPKVRPVLSCDRCEARGFVALTLFEAVA